MCKPVSTPTALSSAAVTQDMNLRMTEFVAVVMGLSIGSFPLYEGHSIGGAGQGLPLQVFPLFSQKHLQFGTFPSAVGLQPHKTDESLLERWSGVPLPLSFDPKCKTPWNNLLGSETGGRGKRVTEFCMLSYLSSPNTDSSSGHSTGSAYRGE